MRVSQVGHIAECINDAFEHPLLIINHHYCQVLSEQDVRIFEEAVEWT